MKILKNLNLNNVLFIDIETVPLVKELKEGTPLYDSWAYKVRHNRDNDKFTGDDLNKTFINNAALYAEFAKIVCITIGKIKDDVLMLKSYANEDEFTLLLGFCKDLNNVINNNKNTVLAGHAIKGFDIPFIMRRCLINQIELPALVDNAHLKPWELTAVDTMELWRSGGFSSASLLNIATALGISSPKDEMEGEETYSYYYHITGGLDMIRKYCEKDVATVCNIILACRYEKSIQHKVSTPSQVEEQVGLVEKLFNNKTVKNRTKLVEQINLLPPDEQEAAATIISAITSK